MTNWALIHTLEGRLFVARQKYNLRHKKRLEYSADAARSKKMHHPEALKRAEGLLHKWGKLEGEEAQVVQRLAARIHQLRPASPVPAGEGTCVPKTSWNPYRRTIANWIARELYDAVDNRGARGVVTSGVRTYSEQKRLYEIYLRGGNVAAPPGESNHEGWNYQLHKGAVDWEPAESLNAALLRKPAHKLLWAETHGLADHPHFSSTGH